MQNISNKEVAAARGGKNVVTVGEEAVNYSSSNWKRGREVSAVVHKAEKE